MAKTTRTYRVSAMSEDETVTVATREVRATSRIRAIVEAAEQICTELNAEMKAKGTDGWIFEPDNFRFTTEVITDPTA